MHMCPKWRAFDSRQHAKTDACRSARLSRGGKSRLSLSSSFAFHGLFTLYTTFARPTFSHTHASYGLPRLWHSRPSPLSFIPVDQLPSSSYLPRISSPLASIGLGSNRLKDRGFAELPARVDMDTLSSLVDLSQAGHDTRLVGLRQNAASSGASASPPPAHLVLPSLARPVPASAVPAPGLRIHLQLMYDHFIVVPCPAWPIHRHIRALQQHNSPRPAQDRRLHPASRRVFLMVWSHRTRHLWLTYWGQPSTYSYTLASLLHSLRDLILPSHVFNRRRSWPSLPPSPTHRALYALIADGSRRICCLEIMGIREFWSGAHSLLLFTFTLSIQHFSSYTTFVMLLLTLTLSNSPPLSRQV